MLSLMVGFKGHAIFMVCFFMDTPFYFTTVVYYVLLLMFALSDFQAGNI